uniref:Putative secreted protein n=1 Tax=Anopheles darlingi TaxID=43151 RepID=A0A2M4D3U4_ANODA
MPNLFFYVCSALSLTAAGCHISFPQFLTRCLSSWDTTHAINIIICFRPHHFTILLLPQYQHLSNLFVFLIMKPFRHLFFKSAHSTPQCMHSPFQRIPTTQKNMLCAENVFNVTLFSLIRNV